jgi:Flp pilus assembly pilin Flp
VIAMQNLIQHFSQDAETTEEEGAALVEYGLLVGLIAVVAVPAIVILGTTIAGYFTNINGAL